MINWREIAEHAGFKNESQMWRNLYVMNEWGSRRIEKFLLNKQNGCHVGHVTILKRLKRWGYKIRGQGGKNHMNPQLYSFCWGNNPKRIKMKGRICKILHRMRANSALIEFIDNGQQEVISRSALRKITKEQASKYIEALG